MLQYTSFSSKRARNKALFISVKYVVCSGREDDAAYWLSRNTRSAESPKDKTPFVAPLNLDEGNGD